MGVKVSAVQLTANAFVSNVSNQTKYVEENIFWFYISRLHIAQ